MKKAVISLSFNRNILSFLLVIILFGFVSNANNPLKSNLLINLSEKVGKNSNSDYQPEMIISGNKIHVIWIETESNNYKLHYCRSLDLGKTWESPKLITTFKYADGNFAYNMSNRKLAVDGENIHIAICDMDWPNGFASKVYYFRSTSGGSSFENAKELASKGGDGWFNTIQIKAANGKIAIVYKGTPNAKSGLFSLTSTDNGATFTEKLITSTNSNLTDLWFDGTQMIVNYESYNEYSAFVAISNNYGASFTTFRLTDEKGTAKQARSKVEGHYNQRIAKSGNNIHIIYNSMNANDQWTVMYALSTDNGVTFKQVDLNNGLITAEQIQYGHESVIAKGNYVYFSYLGKNSMLYMATSADNGASVSASKSILPSGFSYTGGTWFPGLVFDPTDATGATIYAYGNGMFSTKSTDGGKSFSQNMALVPILGSTRHITADLVIDSNGNKHWIAQAQWWEGSDYDIFYRNVSSQPEPGKINKALSVSTVNNGNPELTIVPSSKSLDFDTAMTAEAWIKVDVASLEENYDLSLFAKVNGVDDSYPNGFQITMRKRFGKMVMNPGIETDKGDFIDPFDWSGASGFADTLWHHIAITYDADGGKDNFKTYVDGLLNDKQTVTGKLKQGNGLFMIGTRNSFRFTSNFKIDDVRLWNRALSQDELLQNQTKKLKGNEPGLKLFLNFDDTFKDISGNGNDAIPLYLYKLNTSDFNPPTPAFDLYQSMNQVSLTNKTQNGKVYKWSFGDGTTSDKGNPVYFYPKAGEYQVSLEAANENSKTAIIKKTSIAGLDHIEPIQAGNGGYATISVFGGGLVAQGTTVLLRKNGETDISGEKLVLSATGTLAAYFNLNGKSQGKWDLVVRNGGSEQVMKEVFTITKAVFPSPWVSVSGRGNILLNRWYSYTIDYGNNGNVDALGVPLNLVITDTPNLEFEMIDFEVEPNNYMKENFSSVLNEFKTDYVVLENYFGPGKNARIYPLIVPIIPANSSQSIHIRIKSTVNFNIESWMENPIYITDQATTKNAEKTNDDWPDQKTKLNACIALAAMDAGTSAASNLVGMVLPVGCAYDVFKLVWNPWDAAKPKHDQDKVLNSKLYGFASMTVSCLTELTPLKAFQVGIKAFQLAQSIYEGYKATDDCRRAFDPLYKNRMGIFAFSSFDPNEMIGPAGFDTKHWIQKNNSIPYTILFENKSTATAPAHEVFVTDTLDLQKFDFKEFGFGSFGFGDTTLVPNGKKLKQFSMDINLKPKMNLIARVSGKLDTISGVIRWEFLSLNPTTMEYEEDPFVGFLPPNNEKRDGEGFVSFSVGLKKELGTNATLKNKAVIVFDANKPILTNEFVNTLDLDKPQSQVYPLDATIDSRFPLAWTGSDVGSGVASYSVYVMENDTALHAWKLNTNLKTAEFIGNVGSKYKFYSIATDNVSLMEDTPSTFDASTHITVDVKDFELKKDGLQVFPNPVKDKLNISLPNAPCGMYVVELVSVTGQLYYSEIHDDFSISKGIQINVEGMKSGNYLVRMVFGNKWVTKMVIIN